MDINQLKSEEQMEMMMMMQMDKISELCGAYNDVVSDLPSSEHFSGSATSMPHYSHDQNPHTVSSSPPSSFLNLRPSTISFTNSLEQSPEPQLALDKRASMAAMREMIFRIASMQPIHIDPESVKPPKRRNVKISKDPQSVAARHRRERISERIRILQRLVPGGTKMDTASMLDEAIHYVKFLKSQVQTLERAAVSNNNNRVPQTGIGFPVAMSSGSNFLSNSMAKAYQAHPPQNNQNMQHFGDA
ncbi:hypothetical protein ACLB2K_018810 [Fragaria x ananassa]